MPLVAAKAGTKWSSASRLEQRMEHSIGVMEMFRNGCWLAHLWLEGADEAAALVTCDGTGYNSLRTAWT